MCVEQPAQVLVVKADGLAVVDMAGVRRAVSLALLEVEGVVVAPGDWVVVHTGLAVRVMDEKSARARAALLAEARRTA